MKFKNDRQRKIVMMKLKGRPLDRTILARHSHLTPNQQSRFKNVVTINNVNPTNKRELELYVNNDGDLYRQQFTPIIKNLERKQANGTYDPRKAEISFLNLVENGARKYKKDFGSPSDKIFTKEEKFAVARSMRRDYEREHKLGNYKTLAPKEKEERRLKIQQDLK